MISAYHQNWIEPLMCPLLNIVVDIRTSEKSESGNWHLSECKLGTKCKCLRKHQSTTKRNFLLRVVATQIPKPRYLNPDNLIPTFFLASPISRTRFLLRVVVCNDPRFYQILGEFFLLLFCLRWLEIHRDLKLLSLFESFVWKLFKILYLFSWRTSLRKIKYQNTIFQFFIRTYASLLAKEWITNVFYLVKIVFQKLSLKDNFKHYFIKHCLLFQRIYFQTLF
jgi:hypothetical protein